MKLLCCLLLFAVIAMSQGRKKPHYDVNDAPALFEKYIKDYGKHYKNEADKEEHYLAFIKNLIEINKLNAQSVGPSSAVFGINQFTDYTPEEEKFLHGFVWPPVYKGKGQKNVL